MFTGLSTLRAQQKQVAQEESAAKKQLQDYLKKYTDGGDEPAKKKKRKVKRPPAAAQPAGMQIVDEDVTGFKPIVSKADRLAAAAAVSEDEDEEEGARPCAPQPPSRLRCFQQSPAAAHPSSPPARLSPAAAAPSRAEAPTIANPEEAQYFERQLQQVRAAGAAGPMGPERGVCRHARAATCSERQERNAAGHCSRQLRRPACLAPRLAPSLGARKCGCGFIVYTRCRASFFGAFVDCRGCSSRRRRRRRG